MKLGPVLLCVILLGCKSRSETSDLASPSESAACPDDHPRVDCKFEEKITHSIPKLIQDLNGMGINLFRSGSVRSSFLDLGLFLYNPVTRKVSPSGVINSIHNIWIDDVIQRRRYWGLSMLLLPNDPIVFDPGELSFVLAGGKKGNEVFVVLLGATDNRRKRWDYDNRAIWFFDINWSGLGHGNYKRPWRDQVTKFFEPGPDMLDVSWDKLSCGCFLEVDYNDIKYDDYKYKKGSVFNSYIRRSSNQERVKNYSSFEKCQEDLKKDVDCSLAAYARF